MMARAGSILFSFSLILMQISVRQQRSRWSHVYILVRNYQLVFGIYLNTKLLEK